jgi:hypothetical protein
VVEYFPVDLFDGAGFLSGLVVEEVLRGEFMMASINTGLGWGTNTWCRSSASYKRGMGPSCSDTQNVASLRLSGGLHAFWRSCLFGVERMALERTIEKVEFARYHAAW